MVQEYDLVRGGKKGIAYARVFEATRWAWCSGNERLTMFQLGFPEAGIQYLVRRGHYKQKCLRSGKVGLALRE